MMRLARQAVRSARRGITAAPSTGNRSDMGHLYKHPEEYDLEHLGYTEDIEFYVSTVKKYRPFRLLELGCGTGRITLPLAETGAELGVDVTGLDNEPEMLYKAWGRRRLAP